MPVPGPRTRDLDQKAFDALLAALDPDGVRAGERYVDLRRRLVKFFGWRRVPQAEECADETLDRAARRLLEGTRIDAGDPALYLYGVARNVLREHWAAERGAARVVRDLAEVLPLPAPREDVGTAERRASCLDRCLAALDAPSRELILSYYREQRGAKIRNRLELAATLGLSPESLRVRLHRIRSGLLTCLRRCLSGTDDAIPPPVSRRGRA